MLTCQRALRAYVHTCQRALRVYVLMCQRSLRAYVLTRLAYLRAHCQRALRALRNDLGLEIMKDIFHFVQKPYNLRNDLTLQRRRNRTVYFGTESISSLAPKI